MNKFIVSIILNLLFLSSLASAQHMKLRCFDLFAEQPAESAKSSSGYYAEALDFLNTKYNHFLFKENATAIVRPDLQNLSLLENFRARYQARKLKKILIQLHGLDQSLSPKAKAKVYDLEKIATQIEKLTFLMDDSQLKTMSASDRIAFRQVQHSILAKGLSEFLFTRGTDISVAQKSKIKAIILAPFKKIYLRWILSPVMMPHLDGATIPYSVIEKVVWDGYDNSKQLLAPYLEKTYGKYAFNVFSSSYNFIFTTVIMISAINWVHTATVETYLAYNRGVANAEAMLKPALENAKSLATKDLSAEYRTDTLQISIEKFKERLQRDPTVQEVEILKQLIIARETEKISLSNN